MTSRVFWLPEKTTRDEHTDLSNIQTVMDRRTEEEVKGHTGEEGHVGSY